jgi:acyl-CoA hydrolase
MNLQATPQSAEARFLEVVLPEQANHYGTLYGANALQIMGKAAFVSATRHARCSVVMAKADSIEFRKPISIGAIIDVRATVVVQGKTSMTVLVEVVAENSTGGTRTPSISGRFVMVAIDRDGVPVPLPVSDQFRSEDRLS